MQRSTGTKLQTPYEEPALKRLTLSEAEKFLLHHASLGEQGAMEILALVRPTDKTVE
jgi:hypothetical protein